MSETKHVVILITAASEEEAHTIARHLLDEKKVACVNIISKIDSLFWWQGKLESAKEYLLIAKTKATLVSQVTESIKKHHSYQVPEIIALSIIGGNEDYLKWIEEVVEK